MGGDECDLRAQQFDSGAIELVEREEAAGRYGSVEINVSGKSLANPQLLEVVHTELIRSQIDPSRLIFEVTETAAISHM